MTQHYGPPTYGLSGTLRSHPGVTILPPIFAVRNTRSGGIAAALKALVLVATKGRLFSGDASDEIHEAEVVVSRGGVVFFDRSVRGLLSLWLAVTPLLLAQRLGKKTIVLGAHVGPLTNWWTRLLTRRVMWKADLVLPRGPASLDQVLGLGVDPVRVRAMPDSVFLLAPPEIARAPSERLGFVTISDDARADSGEHPWRQLVMATRRLLDESILDRVVVSVQAKGREDSDVEASRRFAKDVDRAACEVLDDADGPASLMRRYAKGAVIYGYRLHSVVLGLIVGTPGIVLDNPLGKAHDLLSRLRDEVPLMSYDTLDADRLVPEVAKAIDEGAARRETILSQVAAMREEVERVADGTRASIGSV